MEATQEQSAEGLAIVRVLSAVLDRLVYANAPNARSDPGQVTKFHAMKAPGISVEQYLERIHKYASCSNECFILALIYIDRLIQRNNFLLTDLNVHRVVITAILLAAKFFDDAYYNNAYYAKVGGVLVSEMNGLEVEFLFRINFSLHVPPETFEKYRMELLSHSATLLVQQAPAVANYAPTMTVAATPAPYEPTTPMYEEQAHTSYATMDTASHVTPSPDSEIEEQQQHDTETRSQPPPKTSNDESMACMPTYETEIEPAYPTEFYADVNDANRVPPCRSNSMFSAKSFPTPPSCRAQSAISMQLCGAQSAFSAPPTLIAQNHHNLSYSDEYLMAAAAAAHPYYFPMVGPSGVHNGMMDPSHAAGLMHHEAQPPTVHYHHGGICFPMGSLVPDSVGAGTTGYVTTTRRDAVPSMGPAVGGSTHGYNISGVRI